MYRPQRQYAWDASAEKAYEEKRKVLADRGYVTDEDVCLYFAEMGVPNLEPADIRPVILDAVTASPAEKALRSLS